MLSSRSSFTLVRAASELHVEIARRSRFLGLFVSHLLAVLARSIVYAAAEAHFECRNGARGLFIG